MTLVFPISRCASYRVTLGLENRKVTERVSHHKHPCLENRITDSGSFTSRTERLGVGHGRITQSQNQKRKTRKEAEACGLGAGARKEPRSHALVALNRAGHWQRRKLEHISLGLATKIQYSKRKDQKQDQYCWQSPFASRREGGKLLHVSSKQIHT